MRSTRVLTAIVLIPIVVAAVWWGPTWLVALLVAGVILLSLRELFDLGEKIGMSGYRRWTMFCSIGLVFSQWDTMLRQGDWISNPVWLYGLEASLELILVVFVLGVGTIASCHPEGISKALASMVTSAGGLLLVAFPLSYLVRLKGTSSHGQGLLILLVLVWVGDSVAYFVGSAWGKRPLAPKISPRKTWEGAIGNLIGSIIVATAIGIGLKWRSSFDLGWVPVFIMAGSGAIISVAGQIGDLAESAYKRSAGVKDSGAILPGHGGMLDRVDSLIFAAPAVWYYVDIATKLTRNK